MSEDLNSFNPTVIPMPEIPQALGELVAQLILDNPDAIVIDRLSGTVITYPEGVADRESVEENLSITSLLSRYEVNMLETEIESWHKLMSVGNPDEHVALFAYPNTVKEDECPKSLKLMETKVLSPGFLILCSRTASNPSSYLLTGATLKKSIQ